MASRKRSMFSDPDVSPLYKEWDEALCPICMDHPHNAVLLICSSHDKSCRPYICDTSYRHSNCLDRFKKLKEENADGSSAASLLPRSHQASANTSSGGNQGLTTLSHLLADHDNTDTHSLGEGSGEHSTHDYDANPDLVENNMEKLEMSNLRCPLCRGGISGWKVVEEARNYLNLKSRSCSHESCSFSGDYRELRRHARRVHPRVRPADIDPSRESAWRRFEDQREYNDIVSAIRSAVPGAIVVGDYVIESRDRLSAERDGGAVATEGGRWLSTLFFLQMVGSLEPGAELRGGRSRLLPRHRRAAGTSSRRRLLWGENLLGLQDVDVDVDEEEEEEEEEDDEPDLNVRSDHGDGGPSNPRRRRRLSRAQSDDDQQ